MPAPVIPDEGKLAFAHIIQPQIVTGGLPAKVFLFQVGAPTPNYGSQFATYDALKATLAGMTEKDLPVVTATTNPANAAVKTTFTTLTYTSGGAGAETYYGYAVYVTDPADSVKRLLWVQLFDTPQAITAAGQTVQFTLSLSDNQG